MTEDRVEFHLWNWQRQHWLSRESGEGYPSRASGGIECYRSTGDSDRDYDIACKAWADTTDKAIDGLEVRYGTPLYRLAIYAQLLEGPWPYPEIALGVNYRQAVRYLVPMLRQRGLE